MDLDTFRALLAPAGQALLAEAAALAAAGATTLAAVTRLRRLGPPALAAAALEQAILRRKAAASGKFPPALAAGMYFTRAALEQATGAAVAAHRARRYAPRGTVADLGCGIGGDALALARAGPVLAVDRDPLRLLMARENARAWGLAGRVAPVLADLTALPPPRADALFCDPGRRVDDGGGGRRVFSTAAYQPPLATVAGWRAAVPALGVKVSPGIAYDELPALGEAEVEFVSERGALKEAVLWYGPLRGAARRATLLPSGATLATGGEPPPPVPVAPPGRVIYEPDPAVIRAHLVEHLAHLLGAAKLDDEIAYLTADARMPTPFARAYAIEEAFPFGLKRLRARLRALDAGEVTVKKRGSPLDTDALARQLRGSGPRPLIVVLTHVLNKPYVLICSGDSGKGQD